MPKFISKLQHNTYEKGEFSEEQPRTLEETITLIKAFPWDEERPLTDIQLTGPSVTIENEAGEYLKVGLYFNGKYCLYFGDKGDHLYEYHASNITMVSKMVTDFFNCTMALDGFEKHFLSIGSKAHFKTGDFTYTANSGWFYLSFSMLLFFSAIIIGFTIIGLQESLIFFAPALLFAFVLAIAIYVVLRYYVKSKDMILRVSRGANSFEFGDTAIKTFYKNDIDRIKIFQHYNPKSSGRFDVVDIYFKDNRRITFPGILLNHWELPNKFPNIKIEHIANPLSVMKRMREFTQ